MSGIQVGISDLLFGQPLITQTDEAAAGRIAGHWRPVIDRAVKLTGVTPGPLQQHAEFMAKLDSLKGDVESEQAIFDEYLAGKASFTQVQKRLAERDAQLMVNEHADKYPQGSKYMAAVNASRRELIDACQPFAEKAIATLRERSPELDPVLPLDPERIVQRNASDAYIHVVSALNTLIVCGEVYGLPTIKAQSNLHKVSVRHLPAIVDFGDCPKLVMKSLTDQVASGNEKLSQSLHDLTMQVTGQNSAIIKSAAFTPYEAMPEPARLATVLIRIAQGQYHEQIKLSYAPNGDAVRYRIGQLLQGLTTVRPRQD